MGKRNSLKQPLVLVGLLFLPALLFYFFLFNTTAHINRLPFYGPHGYGEIKVPGKRPKTDTILYEMAPQAYLNETGANDSLQFSDGKIRVIHFLPKAIYAAEKPIPDQIVYAAREILSTDNQVLFISLFEALPPEALPQPSGFSDSFDSLANRWNYRFVRDSLEQEQWMKALLPDSNMPQQRPDPQSLVLVDKERRLRGFYNPLLVKDIKHLKEDIGHLNREYAYNFASHKYYKFDDKPTRNPEEE